MRKYSYSLFNHLFFLLFGSLGISLLHAQPITQYVDPFIGSEGGGHVFVGACLPFGMVKLGPDMVGHSNSGYRSDSKVEGFSHTHVSGTGGG
ncbi:MAG: glycoside hydrolase family 92 protein, partial [Cyclobacteriaceae bacterium]|nr:glycoside hydrolase family 92 protein [Cyclobacteriaceae bacterium HetDA_MAG_MS6]